MSLSKPFPRAFAAISVVCMLAAIAVAQTEMRPRHVNAEATSESTRPAMRLENDPFVVSEAPTTAFPAINSTPTVAVSATARLNQMMLAAIDARLGTPYRMGATGPNRYDCSGFVWSVFQSAGIDFERSNAHTLWERFAPATEDEKRQFGTLVFFNNQHHVGIVADAYGFYHASSSRGVVYSPFNDYWLARIDGFRRVQLRSTHTEQPETFIATAAAK